jgi:hypothetical protein
VECGGTMKRAVLLALLLPSLVVDAQYTVPMHTYVSRPCPAFVQGTVAQVGGPFFGCSLTLTGVVAGDAIVAVGFSTHSGVVGSAADSNGDTYTLAGFDNPTSQTVYVAPNVVGGTTTVTLQETGEVSNCMILEYSGIALTSPIDGITFGSASSSSVPLGPVTTTNPRDIILTGLELGSTGALQPTGYTGDFSGSASSGNVDYAASLCAGSAGSYSGTWTLTGSGGHGFIMGLKAL